MLTNRQYAFARDLNGVRVIVTVNNDDNDAFMNLQAGNVSEYTGALSGQHVSVQDGHIQVAVAANNGEIWVPSEVLKDSAEYSAEVQTEPEKSETEELDMKEPDIEEPDMKESDIEEPDMKEPDPEETVSEVSETQIETNKNAENTVSVNKTPEEMTVEELQAAILAKMAGNGPVTDQMKKTVYDNIWHESLVNWLKSFR